MISVYESVFCDNFPSADRVRVSLLDVNEANNEFVASFGIDASSYFDLPDNHWLISGNSTELGRWLEAYNEDRNDSVSQLLMAAVDWHPDERIHFYAKKSIVFETAWETFVNHWDSFLACEDDVPIVKSTKNNRNTILFTPIGDIRLVKCCGPN